MSKANDNKNHDVSLTFRVTDKQYSKLLSEAERMNCNMSQCLRQLLFNRSSTIKKTSAAELMDAVKSMDDMLHELIDICRKTADAKTIERAIRSAEQMLSEIKALCQLIH